MLPGFSGVAAADTADQLAPPSVALAGLWDIPDQKTCRPLRTDTFCTGLVMWCKDVYVCRGGSAGFGREESRTPYPCGVCVGVTSPDDW